MVDTSEHYAILKKFFYSFGGGHKKQSGSGDRR